MSRIMCCSRQSSGSVGRERPIKVVHLSFSLSLPVRAHKCEPLGKKKKMQHKEPLSPVGPLQITAGWTGCRHGLHEMRLCCILLAAGSAPIYSSLFSTPLQFDDGIAPCRSGNNYVKSSIGTDRNRRCVCVISK